MANPLANLKMALPGYNRSDRVGELLEKHLYSSVGDEYDGGRRPLSEMIIRPELRSGFSPVFSNWSRENKVPSLILNATSLNTGHNWQFTAKWMGESPAVIDSDVDANARFRRLYIDDEAPHPHDSLTLGQAVAASASVPGLFDPADLRGLYERSGKKIVVRLVDGGVFDNQGVASLTEQDCRIVLVSDASGQMDFQEDPSGSPLGVPMRSNTILMDRVRQAQYRDLLAQKRIGQLRDLVFIHLKKGLASDPIDWVMCDDPRSAGRTSGQGVGGRTSYQVREDLQRKLADVRTDLDSFCDTEAHALMFSGYQMMAKELEPYLEAALEGESGEQGALARLLLDVDDNPSPSWPFRSVERPMMGAVDRRLETILSCAHERLFKIWRIWLRGQRSRWVLLGGAAGAVTVGTVLERALGLSGKISDFAGWAGGHLDAAADRVWATLGSPVASWLAGKLSVPLEKLQFLVEPAIHWLVGSTGDGSAQAGHWPWLLLVLVIGLAMAPRALGLVVQQLQLVLLGTVGMVLSWVHLWIVDPLYLSHGRQDDATESRLVSWLLGEEEPETPSEAGELGEEE